MTPETAQFLAKAQKLLQEAGAIRKIDLNDVAGRTAPRFLQIRRYRPWRKPSAPSHI